MSILREIKTTTNEIALDAFSNERMATPTFVSDGQFTYDLQPILYEQITAESGATITHDATNRAALMTFSSTPTGGKAFMQSYDWHRYQTGRSQEIFITFNANGATTNVTKFARYGTDANGIGFEVLGDGTKRFVIYSDTTAGDEVANQSSWNLDKLDGTGASGLTLDITKTQILVIDFQALYVGRVRVGFDINGMIIWSHQFNHANLIAYPYIQSANLPIQVGMTCTGTATGTMLFTCSCVLSRGGQEKIGGFSFSQSASVTAGSGARTHALSIRPKATFNSIANRTLFALESFEILVTGSNPVLWEMCIGDVLTGTTTFADVNTTYSAIEYNTAGTTSGTPAVVVESGFCAASTQTKGVAGRETTNRYPITLNAAGAARANGTLTVLVTGLGAASACQVILNWKEIR